MPLARQLKRVYPKPSHIPVRVRMVQSTTFSHYPTTTGQTNFDFDAKKFRAGFVADLPDNLKTGGNKTLDLSFFYIDKELARANNDQLQCAILIYFDATSAAWKVITVRRGTSEDTMKYYKLVNTNLLQEVDSQGNELDDSIVLLGMYFDMETGTWEDLPALAAGEKPAQYDTTVSTFRVRI